MLKSLLTDIRNCTLCKKQLALGPNPIAPKPVIKAHENARILIIGQAPGNKVYQSGIPWDDRSGDRIRSWLNLDKTIFYNEKLIAIMPMGFCFPGIDKNGGDKPPRKECAPMWHDKILKLLPNIQLTLLVGSYAQKYYLADKIKPTMHDTVKAWREYLPNYFPLPHPSWRNTGWLKSNPWFEEELLPELRNRIYKIIKCLD